MNRLCTSCYRKLLPSRFNAYLQFRVHYRDSLGAMEPPNLITAFIRHAPFRHIPPVHLIQRMHAALSLLPSSATCLQIPLWTRVSSKSLGDVTLQMESL